MSISRPELNSKRAHRGRRARTTYNKTTACHSGDLPEDFFQTGNYDPYTAFEGDKADVSLESKDKIIPIYARKRDAATAAEALHPDPAYIDACWPEGITYGRVQDLFGTDLWNFIYHVAIPNYSLASGTKLALAPHGTRHSIMPVELWQMLVLHTVPAILDNPPPADIVYPTLDQLNTIFFSTNPAPTEPQQPCNYTTPILPSYYDDDYDTVCLSAPPGFEPKPYDTKPTMFYCQALMSMIIIFSATAFVLNMLRFVCFSVPDYALPRFPRCNRAIKALKTSLFSYIRVKLMLINGRVTLRPEGTTCTGVYTVADTLDNHQFSRVFRSWKLKLTVEPDKNHPHGYEAAHRKACHNAIYQIISASKRTVYEVSASRRSRGKRGYHDHFTPRDLEYPVQRDKLTHNDVIVMIDVDYYLDMPTWLSYGQPILMYTMTPTAVQGQLHNTYWSLKNNNLEVQVLGGAKYKHRLWNYNHDMLVVNTPYLYKVHARVDIKQVDELRSIIALTPVHFEYTLSWANGIRMCGPDLTRTVTSTTPNFDTLTFNSRDGVMQSIRNNHTSSCITLPQDVITALYQRFIESTKPTITDIQATLDKLGFTRNDPVQSYNIAGVTISYFRELAGRQLEFDSVCEQYTYMVDDIDSSIDATDKSRIDLSKSLPSVTAELPKIPSANTSNEAAAEVTRHQDVRPDIHMKFPGDFYDIVNEFVNLSMHQAGIAPYTLTPYSTEEIEQRQNLPAQRQKNARTNAEPLPLPSQSRNCGVSAFVKAEAYAEIKPPRNISATDPVHTMVLSTYTYAVKENFLKKTSWYCPGLTLPAMAQKLQTFAIMADREHFDLAETDYSKYDGTITKPLREAVEEQFYGHLFALEADNKQLIRLIRSEYHAKAYTRYGRYDPDGSRLSGSPLTTDGNTMIGAAVDYYMLRKLTAFTPAECYDRVGLHFGDDGVSLYLNGVTEIAAQLGLKLKLDKRTRGNPLGFLGRVFPNVWDDLSSIQDPLRVWPKINLVFNGADNTALQQRWYAYLLSDGHTPGLSAYCKKMLDLTGFKYPENYTHSSSEHYLVRATQSMWPQTPSASLGELEQLRSGVDMGLLLKLVAEATDPRDLIRQLRKKVFTQLTLDPLPAHYRLAGDHINIVETRPIPGNDILLPPTYFAKNPTCKNVTQRKQTNKRIFPDEARAQKEAKSASKAATKSPSGSVAPAKI